MKHKFALPVFSFVAITALLLAAVGFVQAPVSAASLSAIPLTCAAGSPVTIAAWTTFTDQNATGGYAADSGTGNITTVGLNAPSWSDRTLGSPIFAVAPWPTIESVAQYAIQFNFDASSYYDIHIKYEYARNTASDPQFTKLYYSGDSGATYTWDAITETITTAWQSTDHDLALGRSLNNKADARIRLTAYGGSPNSNRQLALRNVTIQGCAGSPTATPTATATRTATPTPLVTATSTPSTPTATAPPTATLSPTLPYILHGIRTGLAPTGQTNRFTVEYYILVSNPGSVSNYGLTETLEFGSGVTVLDATRRQDGGVITPISAPFNGMTIVLAPAGTPIGSTNNSLFQVIVTVDVTGALGTANALDCTLQPGDTPGTGLRATATQTGAQSMSRTVCDPVTPVLGLGMKTEEAFYTVDGNQGCVQGPSALIYETSVYNLTGTNFNDVQVSVGSFVTEVTRAGFTGAFGLSPGESSVRNFGSFASGYEDNVYFLLTVPCYNGQGGYYPPDWSGTLAVTLRAKVNGGDSYTSYTYTRRITTRRETSTAVVKINSQSFVYNPSDPKTLPPYVYGKTVWWQVVYDIGNVGASQDLYLDPVGNSTFLAGCFQLDNTDITAVSYAPTNPMVGLTTNDDDTIYFPNVTTNGTNNTVTIIYKFKVVCDGNSSGNFAAPYLDIGSGNIFKYNYSQLTFVDSALWNPSLSLTKEVMSPAPNPVYSTAGTVITYRYTLTNTGNVPLYAPFTVTDDKTTVDCSKKYDGSAQVSMLAAAVPALPPSIPASAGGSTTCKATYTVQASDLTTGNGNIVNVAVGHASDPGDGNTNPPKTVDSNSATQTVYFGKLTLVKTPSRVSFDGVRSTIQYTYTLTNYTNVPLYPPYTVTDDKVTVTCPQTPNPLPAGSSITCGPVTYTTTATDVTAGVVTNTASGAAKDSNGNTVTSNTEVKQVPYVRLTLLKSTTSTSFLAVGEVIPYTFTLKNAGNAPLYAPYVVTDPKVGTVSCPSASPHDVLDPMSSYATNSDDGESVECTASYTVTSADVTNKKVDNTASATAKDAASGGETTTSNNSSATVPLARISLVKSTTTEFYEKAGDSISYSYLITNTGLAKLSTPSGAPVVTDDKASVSCPQFSTVGNNDSWFDPNESVTCTATYSVTADDVTAGSVKNIASATVQDGSKDVTAGPAEKTVPLAQLTIVKSTDATHFTKVGDKITYTYLITNTGQILLNGPFTIVDDYLKAPHPVVTPTCEAPVSPLGIPGGASVSLDTGWTLTCTATYTVESGDVSDGSIINTVTASGTTPGGGEIDSNEDAVEVDLARLFLDKTTSTVSYDAGRTGIHYIFLLRNTGVMPLYAPFVITDSKIGSITCPEEAPHDVLDPPTSLSDTSDGESVTCEADYTVDAHDLTNEVVVNTAAATGYDAPYDAELDQQPVGSNSDTVTVPEALLTLQKTSPTLLFSAVDDEITYHFKLINSGKATLYPPYAVSDSNVGVDCTQALNGDPAPSSLPEGASFTCAASTYTVGQADLDLTYVENTAQATAQDSAPDGSTPKGDTITSNPDSKTVYSNATAELSLSKSVDEAVYRAAGDVLHYHYLLTNTGNVTLFAPYSVADDKTTVTCPGSPASLAPYSPLADPDTYSIECTAEYTVLAQDVANLPKTVTNTAKATAKDPLDQDVDSDDSSVTVPYAALDLTKTPNVASFAKSGDQITYLYTVTNVGTAKLYGPFSITDDKLPSGITCQAINLVGDKDPIFDPGESFTCSGTYTVSAEDVAGGGVTNNATANACAVQDDPDTVQVECSPVDSPEKTATVPYAELTLDKSTVTTSYVAAGNTIAYSYTVTNTGKAPLYAPFTVVDDRLKAPYPAVSVSCTGKPTGSNPLAVDASYSCTATYTVSASDVTAGSVTNTAYATASDKVTGGKTIRSNDDSVMVPYAALSLTKSTESKSFTTAGDEITYSFLLKNVGNVPLYGPFTVTDPKVSSVSCPAKGETGNDDDVLDPPESLSDTSTGESITCTATYTIKAGDVTAEHFNNTAKGYAKDKESGGGTVESNQGSADVPLARLALDKTTSTAYYAAVGDTITYTYKFTNTGQATLSSPFTVDDDKLGALTVGTGTGADVCHVNTPVTTLAPDAFFTCTNTTYAVISDDVTAKSVTNHATVSAHDAAGETITSNQDSVTVPLKAMSLVKTATETHFSAAGDKIHYSFTVMNEGQAPLSSTFSIVDSKMGTLTVGTGTGATTCRVASSVGTLTAGQSFTCTATYTVTSADVSAKTVYNSATAKDGSNFTSPVTDKTVPFAAISLLKSTTTTTYAAVGDTITYSYVVTNVGTAVLATTVSVSDSKITSPNSVSCSIDWNQVGDGDANFDPGEAVLCIATYTVKQADLDAGGVTNLATARTKDPDGNNLDSNTDSVTVPATQLPAIALDKASPRVTDAGTTPYSAVGDKIAYSYTITNTGNVSVYAPLAVVDNRLRSPYPAVSVSCPAISSVGNGNSKLEPGESITCTANYTVVQADLEAGSVVNDAYATAHTKPNDAAGPTVSTAFDTVTVPGTRVQALTLAKAASVASFNRLGQVVRYTYTLANAGNVKLIAPFTVTDSKIGSMTVGTGSGAGICTVPGAVTEIQPRGTLACTADYTVTQTDLDEGTITNLARATAKSGDDTIQSNERTVTIPVNSRFELALAKSASPVTYSKVGDIATYTYVITNKSNRSVYPPYSITDDKVIVFCPTTPTKLLPEDSVTCTADYRIKQADLDAGKVINTATAGAKTNGDGTGNLQSPSAQARIDAVKEPSLRISKDVSNISDTTGDGQLGPGDLIEYTITVTNTGNVSLTNVVISDPKLTFTANTCAGVRLAPGASCYATGTHVLKDGDLVGTLGERTFTNTASVKTDQVCPASSNDPQCKASAIINEGLMPSHDLVLVDTLEPYTLDQVAAIGEVALYEDTVTLPAGSTWPNARLKVLFDPGLAYVGCGDDKIVVTNVTSMQLGTDFSTACGNEVLPDPTGSSTDAQYVIFSFGNLTVDPGADATIKTYIKAVVLNVSSNKDNLNQLAARSVFTWGGTVSGFSAQDANAASGGPKPFSMPNHNPVAKVGINEANIRVTKEALDPNTGAALKTASAGDVIKFRLTVKAVAVDSLLGHESHTPAFELDLTDELPWYLKYFHSDPADPDRFVCTAGSAPDLVEVTETGGKVTLHAHWNVFDQNPITELVGDHSETGICTFTARVADGKDASGTADSSRVYDKATDGPIYNQAQMDWQSIKPADDNHPLAPITGNNPAALPRHFDPASDLNTYGAQDPIVLNPGAPMLELTKVAETKTYSSKGQVVSYLYTLSIPANPGGAPYSPLSAPYVIFDDHIADPINCTIDANGAAVPATIYPPEQELVDQSNLAFKRHDVTCRAKYTITDADMAVTKVTNIASASAATPDFEPDKMGITELRGALETNDDDATIYRTASELPATGFSTAMQRDLARESAPAVSAPASVRLVVPSLRLDMGVQGVENVNGAWSVDWLTGIAGWLQGTAFPGQSGNSVIVGHVNSRYGAAGPFANLHNVRVGENIYIEAFGQRYTYQVTSLGTVDPDSLSPLQHSDSSVLHLVTCSNFNTTTGNFDGRLVVTAKRIAITQLGGR